MSTPSPEELSLTNLKPATERQARKRVGRGLGSGKGRYCGRGVKGQKARAGSHKMRAGFEGGQMPVYMRLGKLRGPNKRKSMPFGPHRTFTVPVNVRELERAFEDGAEVTPEALVERGVIKNTKTDVKILGQGELTKRLTVTAHAFSATARRKIETVGGLAVALRPPVERRAKPRPPGQRAAAEEGVAEEVATEGATESEAEAPESEAEA